MEPRDLPSVDVLADRVHTRHDALPRSLVVELARVALDDARRTIIDGGEADPDELVEARALRLSTARPRRVINATGVLLHTNLGRAPLHPAAALQASEQATGYGNVELDIVTGARGGRAGYVRRLLTTLAGAEAALAVNNNAGALYLALAAIAGRGKVVVSRGELIEIGGSFRLPELMAASGAELHEVGTTNRTRLADYERAVEGAAVILKVHPSNYRIDGFTEDVGYRQLGELAAAKGVPLVADIGSGLLDTRTPWLDDDPPSWLRQEPGARQTIESGASVVLFSGDKLLGGPQAGIAVGRRDLIERMAGHPVARALRLDGPTGAALAGTLELYASGRGREIPFWRIATLSYDDLAARHTAVLDAAGVEGKVVDGESLPGAGSVPGEAIPSPNLELLGGADAWWKRLIGNSPPILGRRRGDAFVLDLRTVEPSDDETVATALRDGR
ncbi:MAG TPA: L-seryl-tRNA(Sec) selenium transferase [Acidimicrobiia bacterium]|jgi:L-seryl-tRNA(Ser) seleniumtransferase